MMQVSDSVSLSVQLASSDQVLVESLNRTLPELTNPMYAFADFTLQWAHYLIYFLDLSPLS